MPTDGTFPVPEPIPCAETAYTTITLTLPNCNDYWAVLMGNLYELCDPGNYDPDDDIDQVTAEFQDMIDLAVYGSSP